MFLDDELLMLARNVELNEESIKECISRMISVCFKNLNTRLNGRNDEQSIIACFQRINKTWQIVADKLNEEGRGFIKRNGFQLFIESNPEFKGIFF